MTLSDEFDKMFRYVLSLLYTFYLTMTATLMGVLEVFSSSLTDSSEKTASDDVTVSKGDGTNVDNLTKTSSEEEEEEGKIQSQAAGNSHSEEGQSETDGKKEVSREENGGELKQALSQEEKLAEEENLIQSGDNAHNTLNGGTENLVDLKPDTFTQEEVSFQQSKPLESKREEPGTPLDMGQGNDTHKNGKFVGDDVSNLQETDFGDDDEMVVINIKSDDTSAEISQSEVKTGNSAQGDLPDAMSYVLDVNDYDPEMPSSSSEEVSEADTVKEVTGQSSDLSDFSQGEEDQKPAVRYTDQSRVQDNDIHSSDSSSSDADETPDDSHQSDDENSLPNNSENIGEKGEKDCESEFDTNENEHRSNYNHLPFDGVDGEASSNATVVKGETQDVDYQLKEEVACSLEDQVETSPVCFQEQDPKDDENDVDLSSKKSSHGSDNKMMQFGEDTNVDERDTSDTESQEEVLNMSSESEEESDDDEEKAEDEETPPAQEIPNDLTEEDHLISSEENAHNASNSGTEDLPDIEPDVVTLEEVSFQQIKPIESKRKEPATPPDMGQGMDTHKKGEFVGEDVSNLQETELDDDDEMVVIDIISDDTSADISRSEVETSNSAQGDLSKVNNHEPEMSRNVEKSEIPVQSIYYPSAPSENNADIPLSSPYNTKGEDELTSESVLPVEHAPPSPAFNVNGADEEHIGSSTATSDDVVVEDQVELSSAASIENAYVSSSPPSDENEKGDESKTASSSPDLYEEQEMNHISSPPPYNNIMEEEIKAQAIASIECADIRNFFNKLKEDDEGDKANEIDSYSPPPKRIYTDDEVREAIRILSTPYPHDDVFSEGDGFYEDFYNDMNWSQTIRVFALVLSPKQIEENNTWFGIFAKRKQTEDDVDIYDFNKTVIEEDDIKPDVKSFSGFTDLTDLLSKVDETPISVEDASGEESQPRLMPLEDKAWEDPQVESVDDILQAVDSLIEDDKNIMSSDSEDLEESETSSASSGMYILDEKQENEHNFYDDRDEPQTHVNSKSRGRVFAITHCNVPSIEVPTSAPEENTSPILGFTSAPPDEAERPSPTRKIKQMSFENDTKPSDVETNILKYSDDHIEYESFVCLKPREEFDVDGPEHDSTSDDSDSVESLEYPPKRTLPYLLHEISSQMSTPSRDHDVVVEYNVFIEHSPRSDEREESSHVTPVDEDISRKQVTVVNPQISDLLNDMSDGDWIAVSEPDEDVDVHTFDFGYRSSSPQLRDEEVKIRETEEASEDIIVPNTLIPEEFKPNFSFYSEPVYSDDEADLDDSSHKRKHSDSEDPALRRKRYKSVNSEVGSITSSSDDETEHAIDSINMKFILMGTVKQPLDSTQEDPESRGEDHYQAVSVEEVEAAPPVFDQQDDPSDNNDSSDDDDDDSSEDEEQGDEEQGDEEQGQFYGYQALINEEREFDSPHVSGRKSTSNSSCSSNDTGQGFGVEYQSLEDKDENISVSSMEESEDFSKTDDLNLNMYLDHNPADSEHKVLGEPCVEFDLYLYHKPRYEDEGEDAENDEDEDESQFGVPHVDEEDEITQGVEELSHSLPMKFDAASDPREEEFIQPNLDESIEISTSDSDWSEVAPVRRQSLSPGDYSEEERIERPKPKFFAIFGTPSSKVHPIEASVSVTPGNELQGSFSPESNDFSDEETKIQSIGAVEVCNERRPDESQKGGNFQREAFGGTLSVSDADKNASEEETSFRDDSPVQYIGSVEVCRDEMGNTKVVEYFEEVQAEEDLEIDEDSESEEEKLSVVNDDTPVEFMGSVEVCRDEMDNTISVEYFEEVEAGKYSESEDDSESEIDNRVTDDTPVEFIGSVEVYRDEMDDTKQSVQYFEELQAEKDSESDSDSISSSSSSSFSSSSDNSREKRFARKAKSYESLRLIYHVTHHSFSSLELGRIVIESNDDMVQSE